MDINELIAVLEEMRTEVGEDAQVQVNIATGESHPIASRLRGVYLQNDSENGATAWLVEGASADDPYSAPREAFTNYIH